MPAVLESQMAESLNRRGNAEHWTVFPFEGIIWRDGRVV